ncbi:hydantoinase/oxoprolinase family protein [Tabrizicola soli]|uniref:hydantoinase/oxoprolinase family protein n=1 Tax=Tabrizicola soli TaxID=2185115 RepID=UPI0036366FA4
MPISIPVIEMIEIGAGGGSIAWVDAMGRIQTGPESAASEPGPACYQRGGERPAITDADLVLGKIDPENFAGGAIRLSVEKAKAAIAREVGDRLGLVPKPPPSASARWWTRTWPMPPASMRSRTARTSRTT